MEENNLKKLKAGYAEIQKKFSLPTFEEMNKDFGIERAAEVETDYLVREVRRFVSDKIANYLRFIETLLNPVNVQIFVFSIVKTLNEDDKKVLTGVYKKLAKKEVDLIALDLNFDEAKEVEFIKDCFGLWQEVKKDISGIVGNIHKNWDSKVEAGKKGYFG